MIAKTKKRPLPQPEAWEVDVIIQSEILKVSIDSNAKVVPEVEIGQELNKNTNKIRWI